MLGSHMCGSYSSCFYAGTLGTCRKCGGKVAARYRMVPQHHAVFTQTKTHNGFQRVGLPLTIIGPTIEQHSQCSPPPVCSGRSPHNLTPVSQVGQNKQAPLRVIKWPFWCPAGFTLLYVFHSFLNVHSASNLPQGYRLYKGTKYEIWCSLFKIVLLPQNKIQTTHNHLSTVGYLDKTIKISVQMRWLRDDVIKGSSLYMRYVNGVTSSVGVGPGRLTASNIGSLVNYWAVPPPPISPHQLTVTTAVQLINISPEGMR